MGDLDQLDDLWQAIRRETDVESLCIKKAELAKLLLEEVDNDCRTLNSVADKDRDLSDLLLECQQLGEGVVGLLEKALPHIDPEYRGGPFEKQLLDLQKNIHESVQKARLLREQNRSLLEHEAELRKNREDLARLETKVDELEKIKRSLRDDNIEALLDRARSAGQSVGTQIARLMGEAVKTLEDARTAMAAHLKANETILAAMEQNQGLTSSSTSDLQRAAECADRMRDSLGEFDEILKKVLHEQETLTKERRVLQEPTA